jgi:hypothetical protein
VAAVTEVELSSRARALASAVEPFAGQVYFAPECHEGYAALGFSPSPFTTESGVQVPDGPAYFTSRGSALGQVPGEVVAAAFGVFDPRIVVPAVTHGWSITDATTIAAARTDGAIGQLARILGQEPDGADRAADLLEEAGEDLAPAGRSLFAGTLAQPVPDTALGRAWRMADRLREYRGDAHIAAWTAAGFDGCSISLMTERWWGLPLRSYSRTRGWTDDAFDTAAERLRADGHFDGDDLTEAGRAAREDLEAATDRQCRPIVESLGDELDELLGILAPWGADIRAAGGYLPSGPHDLARRP